MGPGADLALAESQLLGLLANGNIAGLDHGGDPGAVHKLMGVLDQPGANFAIVTP